MNEGQLGENIHKYLFGRRYLIVMDDMWSIDVWEKVRLYFPENENGSGVLITTRLTNMASRLGSDGLEVDFLDVEQSWNLLQEKVFGQQQKCSLELEEIGKKIAKNCKGLPLSIVVIAGLLSTKSNMTREYWDHVAEQVSSIVAQADDGQGSKILSLSYINLPVHLKPCFLYMAVFPEDQKIKVYRLIRLWVAEGFLKPNKVKSLEEVAKEYLTDLINRNLIMVHEQEVTGNVTLCKVHDLLRDLCLREAQREKFLCVAKSFESLQALHNQRRIVFDGIMKEQTDSSSLLRSITFNNDFDPSFVGGRLIRVLNGDFNGSPEFVVNLVNLRYFDFNFVSKFPSKICLLWNIQTLFIQGTEQGTVALAPREIWEMKQLRHLKLFEVSLPQPPPSSSGMDDGNEDSNMKHLHTLKGTCDLTFSKMVVKRIPNVKNLHLVYNVSTHLERGKDHCPSNLQYLEKLESLSVEADTFSVLQFEPHCVDVNTFLYGADLLGNPIFPYSLKKLHLSRSGIHWKNMTIIGCLPNLQVLRLGFVIGKEWNPIEEQFISLKYLQVARCTQLRLWNAESIHFPVLEQLYIGYVQRLKEIPLSIGDIPTLRSIELNFCSDSTVISAIDILDEQENLGNTDIKVVVWLFEDETQLKNLEARENLRFTMV